jgi:hypothetical protein
MEREDQIPIELTAKTTWCEGGLLDDLGLLSDSLDPKLQPRFTWKDHLGIESQSTFIPDLLDRLYTPEIKALTNAECLWIPSSATKSNATDKSIKKPSEIPQEVCAVPTALATDLFDRLPNLLERCIG